MSRKKSDFSESGHLIDLGARIRIARGERKQSWLAKAIGARKSQISEWENGKYSLRVETLIKIAEVTGCDPGWLLGGTRIGDGMLREDLYPYCNKPPEGVHPDAWEAVRALLEKLSDIHEAQKIEKHKDRWGSLVVLIETFAELIRADLEAQRRSKTNPPAPEHLDGDRQDNFML